jgi:hypothetical protein
MEIQSLFVIRYPQSTEIDETKSAGGGHRLVRFASQEKIRRQNTGRRVAISSLEQPLVAG